jgi:hypothetical protein
VLAGGLLLGSLACAERGRGDVATSPAPSEAHSTADYEAAWTARLEQLEGDEPALAGSETCAAEVVVDVVTPQIHRDFGVDPDDVAGGGSIGDLPISGAEEGDVMDALVDCELAAPLVGNIEAVIGFLDHDEAVCTSDAIVAQPTYRHLVARWILGDDDADWLDRISHVFDIGVRSCPDAYVALTLGGIQLETGDLSPEALVCLEAGLRAELDDLLGTNAMDAGQALDRVLQPCRDEMGDQADVLYD